MDYFVSSEDTAYGLWQTELLIQSFKMAGLEESLVVAVAGNDEPKVVNFQRNLSPHKRRFRHENIGRKRGLLPMNKPYSVYQGLASGVLTQPFVLLSPDMVLAKEVQPDAANVRLQVNHGLTKEVCESAHVPVSKHVAGLLSSVPKADHNCWVPLGSVMCFDDVPHEFFVRVLNWCETLEFDRHRHFVESRQPAPECFLSEKAAWVLALIEFWGTLHVQPKENLEMTLLDHRMDHHFVHYRHGLPPVFSKGMFRYEPPTALALGDLFHTLLSHNPTTSTSVLQGVVRSYVEEHGVEVEEPRYEENAISVAVVSEPPADPLL
jgi:hypothetical protein